MTATGALREGAWHCLRLSAWRSSLQPSQSYSSASLYQHVGSVRYSSGAQEEATTSGRPLADIDRKLRQSHAAEVAAEAFFKAQKLTSRSHKRDIDFFQEQERHALDQAKDLLPRFRARPSLIQGLLRVGGAAAGAAAGLAPRPLQLAIWGAVAEVLEEQHTDTLRGVLEASADHTVDTHRVDELREALRSMRDTDRVPEGAPNAPDITVLQSSETLKQIGLTGVAALAVKLAGKAALQAAGRL